MFRNKPKFHWWFEEDNLFTQIFSFSRMKSISKTQVPKIFNNILFISQVLQFNQAISNWLHLINTNLNINMNFPKIHSLLEMPYSIMTKGSLPYSSTEHYEESHKYFIKEPLQNASPKYQANAIIQSYQIQQLKRKETIYHKMQSKTLTPFHFIKLSTTSQLLDSNNIKQLFDEHHNNLDYSTLNSIKSLSEIYTSIIRKHFSLKLIGWTRKTHYKKLICKQEFHGYERRDFFHYKSNNSIQTARAIAILTINGLEQRVLARKYHIINLKENDQQQHYLKMGLALLQPTPVCNILVPCDDIIKIIDCIPDTEISSKQIIYSGKYWYNITAEMW